MRRRKKNGATMFIKCVYRPVCTTPNDHDLCVINRKYFVCLYQLCTELYNGSLFKHTKIRTTLRINTIKKSSVTVFRPILYTFYRQTCIPDLFHWFLNRMRVVCFNYTSILPEFFAPSLQIYWYLWQKLSGSKHVARRCTCS